ncbi:IS3 family transposase, partial [Candidatus Neptunochlamydia vexilliferae]|uniref:IS3 family transposase n=1 Tax=Candidatus Neptunichlamydia vexilliferae TaxID=1651774 RepID=UPI001E2FC951
KRRSLVNPEDECFSQRKQCELLSVWRSGLYYQSRGPSQEDLQLMRAIDEQYLKTPFYGRRRMTLEMRDQGFLVGEKKVRSAM